MLESKSRTGTRQAKDIHNLKSQFSLFVVSQCDFCSRARRFCYTWMTSCKGPILCWGSCAWLRYLCKYSKTILGYLILCGGQKWRTDTTVENLGNKKLEICSQGSKIAESTRVSPHEVLQSWLINTVYHLLVKNINGEGRGFELKERGAY